MVSSSAGVDAPAARMAGVASRNVAPKSLGPSMGRLCFQAKADAREEADRDEGGEAGGPAWRQFYFDAAQRNIKPRFTHPGGNVHAWGSPGLEAVILRALEKDRNLRYQHAADMRAELQRLKRDSDSGRHVTARSSTPAHGVQLEEAPPSPSGTVAPPKIRRRLLAGAAVVLIGVLIGGGLYYRSRQHKVLTDKDTILVADFDNKTGDVVFDDTLRQGLAVQLEQSRFFTLTSEEQIQRTLQMMGRPVDARLTPHIAREICQRTNGAAVLEGSICAGRHRIRPNSEGCELRNGRAAGQYGSKGQRQKPCSGFS